MRKVSLWQGFAITGLLCALSCKEKEKPGFIWEVSVISAEDGCNTPPVEYNGAVNMDYLLRFDESRVVLSVDGVDFASGTISGCEIEYESSVWGEARDGNEIKWQLTGTATYRSGGTACNLPDGRDWEGQEVFTIVSSEHPDIASGCTYTLDLNGVYRGESEGS